MMIKNKYIDPFTDFGFKHIFGTEENKRFLISFLNDLLDIEDKIVDLEYRNLEKLGLNIVDRRAVFDVYCTDTSNNNFIVELQRSKQKYFKDRSLYYTSFPIQQQSKKGDWNYRLKKIFFVGILDFTLDDENYLTEVQLKDGDNEVFYDKLKYYYLQMPNFKKQEKELSNHLEYWLYYLNHLADSQSIPETLAEDDLITDAFQVAEFLALDEDEQFAYQLDLKARLDYKNVMDYAREEAKKEGKVEGKAEGKAEGKIEEKIELAKNLLDILDNETIADKTGLSIETVKRLQQEP
ncbi:MAG: PD-(D/E)XK nuclease family transposase [Cocleimonas sp.]|nr:PD-(D/E)XK nuclease family transposase [Cocleimonas sp.]